MNVSQSSVNRGLLIVKLQELRELFPNYGFVMLIAEFDTNESWAWSNMDDPKPFVNHMSNSNGWESQKVKGDK